METTVVNIYHLADGWKDDSSYAYIGRAGHGLPGTFRNDHYVEPRKCFKCNTIHKRGEAVEAFKHDFIVRVKSDPEFVKQLLTIRGKQLVCFCSPRSCHGDVIATFLNNLPKEA